MTLYAHLAEDGSIDEYPYNLFNLSKSVSLPYNPSPALLSKYDVVVVEASPKPDVDHTKNVTEGSPAAIEGKWVQQWLVSPASEREIIERTEAELTSVKRRRNELLQSSDWTQLPDVNVDKEAWADYREKLRQLKYQPGFPWGVIWPVPPT